MVYSNKKQSFNSTIFSNKIHLYRSHCYNYMTNAPHETNHMWVVVKVLQLLERMHTNKYIAQQFGIVLGSYLYMVGRMCGAVMFIFSDAHLVYPSPIRAPARRISWNIYKCSFQHDSHIARDAPDIANSDRVMRIIHSSRACGSALLRLYKYA